MKRWMGSVVVVALALATASACRQYMPSNRYLQVREPSQTRLSTADARDKFNHGAHAPALAKSGMTCVDCHRFDALIETGNEQMARELSAHAQYPRGAACHFCHSPGETHVARAPQTCTTCHDNMAPLEPEDHQIAWLKVHESASRADPARCDSCHNQAFCIDCHERRDSIQTRMHERNFRFFHSVQARANPMQCGSCHREDFCINCHKQGKVDAPQ